MAGNGNEEMFKTTLTGGFDKDDVLRQVQKMKDEGVTVVEPSEEVLAGFKEKAQPFYEMGADFGWSDGLYDTVKKAMGAE